MPIWSPAFFGSGAGGASGYVVENSLWFDGSADYLTRTPSSAGNQQIWTLSWWQKKTWTGVSSPGFWGVGDLNFSSGNANDWIFYDNGDHINIQLSDASSGTDANMTSALDDRDPTAWAHWIVAVNTTLSTASERVRVYRNGTEITDFGSPTDPGTSINCRTNGTDQHVIGGGVTNSSNWWSGYLAEIIMVDGAQEVPADFGELDDNGVWVPINPSGLTFGTNGFLLQFKQNGSGQNSSGIGADTSGEDNHWAVGGGAVNTNQVTDTCTDDSDNNVGNYATFNAIDRHGSTTLSNGNLHANGTTTHEAQIRTTIVLTGKKYWEIEADTLNADAAFIGILKTNTDITTMNNHSLGTTADGYSINCSTGSNNGKLFNNNTNGTDLGTIANGDVISVAFDADTRKLFFGKNGSWLGSADPANGTNPAYTASVGTYTAAVSVYTTSSLFKANFGQTAFSYTVPTGFDAGINTADLAAPTVTNPSEFFGTLIWSGDNASSRDVVQGGSGITGTVNFTPDFCIIKGRNVDARNKVYDVARGTSSGKDINTDQTAQEDAETTNGYVSAFKAPAGSNGGGVTLTRQTNAYYYNDSGKNYVGYFLKAGGSTSEIAVGSVSTGVPSIASDVSVASHNGFAVVKYGDCGGAAKTVGHGMGKTPDMIWVKATSGGSAGSRNWRVWTKDLTSDYVMYLDLIDDQVSEAASFGTINANTFGVDGGSGTSANGELHIAYCFARTPGLIGVGTYTGNSSTDGAAVIIDDGASGFRPALVMVKRMDVDDEWVVVDSTRSPENVTKIYHAWNYSDAERTTGTAVEFDFLANGFKCRVSHARCNVGTYAYLAFAENPFGGDGVAQARAR